MLEAEAVQKYVNLQLILILKISSGACERVFTCKNRRNLVPREYLVFLFCQKRTERSCLLACVNTNENEPLKVSLTLNLRNEFSLTHIGPGAYPDED